MEAPPTGNVVPGEVYIFLQMGKMVLDSLLLFKQGAIKEGEINNTSRDKERSQLAPGLKCMAVSKVYGLEVYGHPLYTPPVPKLALFAVYAVYAIMGQ